MRRRNFTLCCCTLLFIASSSEALKISRTMTSDNERNNSTVRYHIHTNVTTTNRSGDAETMGYKARENSIRSDDDVQYKLRLNSTSIHEDDDSVGYKFHTHSTKDHSGGDQTSMELRTNSTDDKINSTAHEPRGNLTQDVIEDRRNLTYELFGKFYKDENKTNVVPYEMCENITCISLCCPLSVRMKNQCVAENIERYPFPGVYEQATNESLQKGPIGDVDRILQLTVHDPCQKDRRYLLDPDNYPDDAFMFLLNGSLYLPRSEYLIDAGEYCLIVLQRNKYKIAVCINFTKSVLPEVYYIGLIISLPFLLTTFLVYSILPELQNIHGYTLRGYVGSLFVAYTFLAIPQLTAQTPIPETAFCKIMAFIIYFSFFASFFWLNVMCFDIWWTFGRFRSSQGNVKQQERKKFVMYSIYAWGSASILTIICVIMDFVPSLPKELIRPEFGKMTCWFSTNEARALYFYLPMSVTVICNIYLFTSTARKIVRQKKDTAAHFRNSESRCHDDNKQWFNLYLKLFILMGINWCMEIISWMFEGEPSYIWYMSDLTNTLQGLVIFIIFVWKKKIKRLLLKRFGCQDCGLFSRNSTRSGCHSSSSSTCTTTSGMMSLQEVNLCANKLPHEEFVR